MHDCVILRSSRGGPSNPYSYFTFKPRGFDLCQAILVHLWPSLDIHAALKQGGPRPVFLCQSSTACVALLISVGCRPRGKDNCLSCLALVPAPSRRPGVFNAIDTTLLSGVLVLWMYYSLWKLRRGYSSSSRSPLRQCCCSSQVSLSTPFLVLWLFLYSVEGAVAHGGALLADNWRNLWVYVAKQYGQFGLLRHLL